MTKCKKCNCNCHCNKKPHSNNQSVCTCDDCKCKRVYKKQKDHGNDMSYENEVKYDG